jgi:alpha-tubulin suppressor-like RCC1 family protein
MQCIYKHACGGRHTMVWLTNGNVFSFGNNFFAQLGYDFKDQDHKENQVVTIVTSTVYIWMIYFNSHMRIDEQITNIIPK